MLLNSDESITAICDRVGFNTLRTFNRAFMKQMNTSPSDYRKQGQRRDGVSVKSSSKRGGEDDCFC